MTITREQIEMYASAADATQTFGMDKGKLIAVEPEHMQELARMALAGMEKQYDISAEELRKAVHYNPDTGVFTRRSNGVEIVHIDGVGYRCFNLANKVRLAHRMAFYYMTGRIPDYVDHIDGNKLNNEWKNLREATNAENQWNKGMITTNTSGVRGVHWNKKLRRWIAEIRVNKVKHYIGSYRDLQDAKEAVEKKREEFHGNFLCTHDNKRTIEGATNSTSSND